MILKPVLIFNPEKLREHFQKVTFLDVTSTCFPSLVNACNLLNVTSLQKQATDVSLVLKDSDMDSENLGSLIRLSVSDGQKTYSS